MQLSPDSKKLLSLRYIARRGRLWRPPIGSGCQVSIRAFQRLPFAVPKKEERLRQEPLIRKCSLSARAPDKTDTDSDHDVQHMRVSSFRSAECESLTPCQNAQKRRRSCRTMDRFAIHANPALVLGLFCLVG